MLYVHVLKDGFQNNTLGSRAIFVVDTLSEFVNDLSFTVKFPTILELVFDGNQRGDCKLDNIFYNL
jgi:hypothetical protein